MTKNINLDELQEMKEQLHMIKQQIAEHTTLHEENLHKTLRHNANRFRTKERSSICLIAFTLLMLTPMFIILHFSMIFTIFTIAFFFFALLWSLVVYKKLHIGHILDQDLVSAQRDLQGYIRQNQFWLYRIGIPFLIIWFPWYVYDYLQVLGSMTTTQIIAIVSGLLVGGCIGGCIGYFAYYRPQMNRAKQMLEDIASLSNPA